MKTDIVYRDENGQPMTNSYLVAETFGKNHFHVVRDIENLLVDLKSVDNQCNPKLDSVTQSFSEFYYDEPQPNGGSKPAKGYILNRDGFVLLAMGYTGKKALAFKVQYMNAFNRMERMLGGNAAIPASDNRRLHLLEKENDLLRRELALKNEQLQLQQEQHALQMECSNTLEATPIPTATTSPCIPTGRTQPLQAELPLYVEPEPVVDHEEEARRDFANFANLFFENPDNLGLPVSIRESTISWLLYREVTADSRSIALSVPTFRRMMERYCQDSDIIINATPLLRTTTDLSTGLFRCTHPSSKFYKDKVIIPRRRTYIRGRVESCTIFYKEGMTQFTDPLNRPKAGEKSGLLPE